MSGPKIAALYGLIPNQLGLCGPRQSRLRQFIQGKLTTTQIIPILKQFEAAYPYYQLIAKKNKITAGPLNKKVVEAYWIGNELLDKITADDLRQMIVEKFRKPGLLSEKEAKTKVKLIPKDSKPHHSFHVLILGSITGRVDFTGNTKLKDICRVGWGKVTRIVIPAKLVLDRDRGAGIQNSKTWIPAFAGTASGFRIKSGMTDNIGKIIVKYQPLAGNKIIKLGPPKQKEIFWDKDILPEVKIGDWVSFHWNYAIQILKEQDIVNLYKYTQNTLDSLYEK